MEVGLALVSSPVASKEYGRISVHSSKVMAMLEMENGDIIVVKRSSFVS
jgi:hypothetical protein